MTRAGKTFGPRQFPAALGLKVWEFERAVQAGLIPARPAGGRWPAAAVEAARERLEAIREQVGDLPDLGAVRVAQALAERLGTAVEPDTVEELARLGLLRVAGDFKGYPLYCGRSVAAFSDRAVLEEARWSGYKRTRASAVAYLRVRDADFAHLLRAGRLVPVKWVQSPHQSKRSRGSVPLFRTGDLDAVLADRRIDWVAVRATPRGRRSVLERLPAAAGRRRAAG